MCVRGVLVEGVAAHVGEDPLVHEVLDRLHSHAPPTPPRPQPHVPATCPATRPRHARMPNTVSWAQRRPDPPGRRAPRPHT